MIEINAEINQETYELIRSIVENTTLDFNEVVQSLLYASAKASQSVSSGAIAS